MIEKTSIYDETASKILVMLLRASDDIEKISAANALIRHLSKDGQDLHNAKIFSVNGTDSAWMSSLLQSEEYLHKRTTEAQRAAERYRKRLAVLEAALKKHRDVIPYRIVGGKDKTDALLRMEIENIRITDDEPPKKRRERL